MRTLLPVKLALVSMLAIALPHSAALAQMQSTTPPIAYQPVPGDLELAKLVWSTMCAVDHANQAGNYSVLRDLSAPGFQINNDSAALATVFAGIRSSRLDLSNTLLLAPTYSEAPRMLADNVLQVKGFFGLRPSAIQFDLQFQWVQGKWRLYGILITPATIAQSMPGPAVQQQGPTRNRN